jgi:acetyltransferase-like isoleucine patch superfamily enzyme/acyl carrier protein
MRRVSKPHPVEWAYARRHRARLARYKREGLTVGENFVSFAPLYISDPDMVTIGNNVSIAPNVHLVTHDATGWHLARIGVTDAASRLGSIVVHDDCGIGYGAMILPGVSIGPRSVVGAGSVVRTDVPPETVVLGNPARVATTLSGLARRLEADISEVVRFVRALLERRWPGRFSPEGLGSDVPLDAAGLGLDSVEIVELVLACEERYGVRLPENLLATSPLTISRLAEHVALVGARPLRDVPADERGA